MTTNQKVNNATTGTSLEKNFHQEIRLDIDELVLVCGHFTDCETNNGYGCNHPKNEEDGECHRIGCPVAAYDSDKDEMVVFDAEVIRKIEQVE